jgi:hypothetical protein
LFLRKKSTAEVALKNIQIYIHTFCLAGWGNDYNHHEKACRQRHEGLCPIAAECHQEAKRENAVNAPFFSDKRR